MSKNSGLFFLNRSIKHYKIDCMNMKFNRFTINMISFFITSFIILLIIIVPKYLFKQNRESKSNIDNKINISEPSIDENIVDWKIKIPGMMLNRSIIEGDLDNQIEKEIIHYRKSYIKEGTILLFCKDKIDSFSKGLSIYYKVNSKIYEYRIVEKNYIKKEEIDGLLRRRK